MIGSPALRGAVASVTGAGRACRGAADAADVASSVINTVATPAERQKRRIANCCVIAAMPNPIELSVCGCRARKFRCYGVLVHLRGGGAPSRRYLLRGFRHYIDSDIGKLYGPRHHDGCER